MSLKNYIFSSINTKGAQDSDKFATIRLKSLRGVKTMAITSDDNNTTPNRAETAVASQQSVAKKSETNGTRTDSSGDEEFSCSWFFLGKGFLKIWSYITVEPLMLCWLLPSCFLFIAVENLALEKVFFFVVFCFVLFYFVVRAFESDLLTFDCLIFSHAVLISTIVIKSAIT